jgi:hypothetical protein
MCYNKSLLYYCNGQKRQSCGGNPRAAACAKKSESESESERESESESETRKRES